MQRHDERHRCPSLAMLGKVSHLHLQSGLSHLHNPRSMWRAEGHHHNHPILAVLPTRSRVYKFCSLLTRHC